MRITPVRSHRELSTSCLNRCNPQKSMKGIAQSRRKRLKVSIFFEKQPPLAIKGLPLFERKSANKSIVSKLCGEALTGLAMDDTMQSISESPDLE